MSSSLFFTKNFKRNRFRQNRIFRWAKIFSFIVFRQKDFRRRESRGSKMERFWTRIAIKTWLSITTMIWLSKLRGKQSCSNSEIQFSFQIQRFRRLRLSRRKHRRQPRIACRQNRSENGRNLVSLVRLVKMPAKFLRQNSRFSNSRLRRSCAAQRR